MVLQQGVEPSSQAGAASLCLLNHGHSPASFRHHGTSPSWKALRLKSFHIRRNARAILGSGLAVRVRAPTSSLQLISISGRTEPAEGRSACLREPRGLQTLACALERGAWAAASCTGTSDCTLKVLYQDFRCFLFFF